MSKWIIIFAIALLWGLLMLVDMPGGSCVWDCWRCSDDRLCYQEIENKIKAIRNGLLLGKVYRRAMIRKDF